jgi:hypothetical protein
MMLPRCGTRVLVATHHAVAPGLGTGLLSARALGEAFRSPEFQNAARYHDSTVAAPRRGTASSGGSSA